MNRRQLLKLLALGVGSLELDLDSLLWVPGKKTIFLPEVPKGISMAQIVLAEYERILPRMRYLFEQDNLFYEVLAKEEHLTTQKNEMIVKFHDRPTDNKIH